MSIKKTKIQELKNDSRNANKGTDLGKQLLENSIQKYGLGRSILIDKNGATIAGNHVLIEAKKQGVKEVIIVPTDGSVLVAVQRTDVDLNTKEGVELALADNRVNEKNLNWDTEIIEQLNSEFDLELQDLGFNLDSEDEDYSDAADQMETDRFESKGKTSSDYEQNIFPLAIVMTKATRLEWEKLKQRNKLSSDQSAFEFIYHNAVKAGL